MSSQDIESILLPLGKETQGFNTPQKFSNSDSGELKSCQKRLCLMKVYTGFRGLLLLFKPGQKFSKHKLRAL